MSHFRVVCEHGHTVSQCRCPSPNKEVRREGGVCHRRHANGSLKPVLAPVDPIVATTPQTGSYGVVVAQAQTPAEVVGNKAVIVVEFDFPEGTQPDQMWLVWQDSMARVRATLEDEPAMGYKNTHVAIREVANNILNQLKPEGGQQ